jgi:hypothetical protein
MIYIYDRHAAIAREIADLESASEAPGSTVEANMRRQDAHLYQRS